MSVLFILLAVGFAAGKIKLLTPDGNMTLTKIVLFIALPCTILNSVISSDIKISVEETLFYLLMALFAFVIAFAVAIPLIKLSGGERANHGLLTYMSVYSNSGFMGFPVAIALFGAAGAFFTALFNIWFNLLSFSVGVLLIAGRGSKINLKLLFNPPLIAALLAVPIALTDFTPVGIVAEAIGLFGNFTTPGAMLVIGASLSFIPIKNAFPEWRICLVAVIKLALVPVVTWLVLKQFIESREMLGVLVILAAMPTGAQSAMLAIWYGGDAKTASAGIFVTTLLCAVTVPLIVYLLQIV